MGLGIMQGIGEQAKTMAFGAGRSDPYGFFGGKGPGVRSLYEKTGFAGAYRGMKNWLGAGFTEAGMAAGTATPFLETIAPNLARARQVGGGITFKEASAVFRRRQIGTGIGAGVGALALGGTVGYGNVLKGGGMWAAGSMIGGALGATKTFRGQEIAGRRIGGRVGLGLFGGYKAAKWGGQKLGLW